MQRLKYIILSLVSAMFLRIPEFILLLIVCMVQLSGHDWYEVSSRIPDHPVLYGIIAVLILATEIKYPVFVWVLFQIRKRKDRKVSGKKALLYILVYMAVSLAITPMVVALVEQLHLSGHTYVEFKEILDYGFIEAVIIAPVVEEWLFRNRVLSHARKIFPWQWAAIAYQAALFGMIHMNAYQGIHSFIMGLLLGYCHERTGNLKLCMAMHAANNLLSFYLS